MIAGLGLGQPTLISSSDMYLGSGGDGLGLGVDIGLSYLEP